MSSASIFSVLFLDTEYTAGFVPAGSYVARERLSGPISENGSTAVSRPQPPSPDSRPVTGPLRPALASPSWQQAAIDLGAVHTIDWINWWPPRPEDIPAAWTIEASLDASSYGQVFALRQVQRRTQVGMLVHAPCYLSNGRLTLVPLRLRYLRIAFQPQAGHNGRSAEWGVEFRLNAAPSGPVS